MGRLIRNLISSRLHQFGVIRLRSLMGMFLRIDSNDFTSHIIYTKAWTKKEHYFLDSVLYGDFRCLCLC